MVPHSRKPPGTLSLSPSLLPFPRFPDRANRNTTHGSFRFNYTRDYNLLTDNQASALITNSDPSNLGQLWVHLTHQPEYQSVEKRKMLNTRLREFLLKQWITIGVPYVIHHPNSFPRDSRPDAPKKIQLRSF